METYRMHAERIDVVSDKSFSEVVAILEKNVPTAEISALVHMITARFTAGQIQRAVEGMVGDLGFLILAKLDQGTLVSMLGRPKKNEHVSDRQPGPR